MAASTTALLEKVAPEIPSTFLPSSKGPAWPTNCLIKFSSFTRVPKPSVSPKLLFSPTVMATILPASSTVTTTSMGLSNPSLVALAVRPSAATADSGAEVLCAAAPPPKVANASLTPFTTAVEVMVAPDTPSTSVPRVTEPDLPINWLVNASSFALAPKPGVSANLSPPTVRLVMAPLSSTVMVTSMGPPNPSTVAVADLPSAADAAMGSSGALVASGAAVLCASVPPLNTANASLTPFTTAVEVIVAPETASTSVPRATEPDLPINWLVKASSLAFAPKPGVSANLSPPTVRLAMAPLSSTVTVTSMGPAKPSTVTVADLPSAAGTTVGSSGAWVASGAGVDCATGAPLKAASASFTPLTTAVEVMVAPDTPSTSVPRATEPDLPINWLVKASSCAFAPKPGVSANCSPPTVRAVIAPASSTVTITSMGPPNPSTVATAVLPSTFGPAGAPLNAVKPSFTPSTTAVEVMVAPEMASTSVPSVTEPDLPINWVVKASSLAFAPKPGVSANCSPPTLMAVMAPASSTVMLISIGAANPSLVITAVLPLITTLLGTSPPPMLKPATEATY